MFKLGLEDSLCILCGVFTFGLVLEVLSLIFEIVSLFAIGNFMILVSVVMIIREVVLQIAKYQEEND